VFLYHSFFNSGGLSPSKGEQLPKLGTYLWNSSPHTLVFAVRKGCHFCEESMPFYRRLAELKKQDRAKVNLIAVLPDSWEDAQETLRSQHVDIPLTSGVNLVDLKVGGTPTLILAENNGKVEKYWVGKQGLSGEESILEAIEH
jgi:hypothetical protein